LYLIQTYGKRPDKVFGVSVGDKDLSDTIQDNLSTSRINEVNRALQAKRIQFRW
jgi:hypothetical protein